MRRIGFWLRWSARDLRRRWAQVVAIALIIALGTGVQAGLGSTSEWRQLSYDASYAMLDMHDLRVTLNDGSFVPAGTLVSALARMEHPEWIRTAEERLIVSTQVDASTASQAVLVPGRIVGVDVRDDGPAVDGISPIGGRALTLADDGKPVAVLDGHFATHYGLPSSGRIGLPGGVHVGYVGTGYSPEYFMVVNDTGGFSFMAEANFAVMFAPLGTAGALSGHQGQVNDLVLRLAPGVGPAVARTEVEAALGSSLPDVGASVATRGEDTVYRLMYGDLDSDQGTFNLLALLMLIAAVFAAFNLTSRIVEAQRREIGIGMALGVPRWRIAVRPLLIGAEIAFLGVLFGVGVGLLVGWSLEIQFDRLMPLPVWETRFQPGRFVAAAALGFLLPFLATAWPVWRAVRVEPVKAMRTGHLASRGGGLAPLVKRIPLPVGSFGQMPVRNVLRAPRRTVLTAIGIGAAIMALVGILGMLDSMMATIDRGDAELLRGDPDRVTVDLAGFQPVDSAVVVAIDGSPSIGASEPILHVGGFLQSGDMKFEVFLDVLDLSSSIWHPTIGSPTPSDGLPGIVIAQKAATDLGVSPGDTIDVLHPVREGETAFATATTQMRVVGIHTNPVRSFAYMDTRDAGLLGLAGFANSMQVLPAPGATVDDVKRAMFALPGVASVQPVSATAQTLRDLIDQMGGFFAVIEFFALALALLVSFNAASINVDERAREHATMLAFGMRLRTLLRMTSVESLIVGLLGALIGIGVGVAALGALMTSATTEAPEIGMLTRLAPASVAAAVGFGVLAALLAPLLTARKLRLMDVASMLRVME